METNSGQVVLVKEINPDEEFGYPGDFTELNGKLYFTTNNGVVNGDELWATDGTTEGTQLVKDIYLSGFFFNPDLTVFDSKLYFGADDGVHGYELWVSDGTTEGTQLVKNIYPGSFDPAPYDRYVRNPFAASLPNSSYPSSFTELNDRLYFEADDGVHGHELWATDGTTEGTQLVKDINPGDAGSQPGGYEGEFTQFNNKLYFEADDGVHGYELWATDGTTEGTQLVKDINLGSEGTVIENLTTSGDRLYFEADDGVHGHELWATDGTTEGTQLVKDINPGDAGSQPGGYEGELTQFNNKLYFEADDGIHGYELWATDGTTEGTQLVKDINLGSEGTVIENLTTSVDRLYFEADDGVHGNELWVSDGTTEGTQLVKDINPGDAGSYPENLTVFNNQLYFEADDGVNGNELWVSDGTTEGTQLMTDITPGSVGSDISNSTVFNNELLFESDNKLFKIIFYNLDKGTNDSDELNGTSDRDRLESLNGQDTLTGDAGNDMLFGNAGDDSLFGGADNDVLIGGAGDDVLTGGAGEDFFALATEGEDTITDFQLGSDLLGLTGLNYEDLTFSNNAIYADDRLLVNILNINTENLTIANFV